MELMMIDRLFAVEMCLCDFCREGGVWMRECQMVWSVDK